MPVTYSTLLSRVTRHGDNADVIRKTAANLRRAPEQIRVYAQEPAEVESGLDMQE